MDMEKNWPYIAGAGILLVLLVLARSGGGGSAPMLVGSSSSPADDALALAREQDRTSLLGTVVNAATALQGSVNGYRGAVAVTDAQYKGEAVITGLQGDTARALATVAAGRDTMINRDSTQAAVTANRDSANAAVKMNYDNADRDITIGKANARAATNNGFFGSLGAIAGAVTKLFHF